VDLVKKLLIFCAWLGGLGTSLMAQDVVFKSSGAPSSLIELYSSEGCSSCPPAEEWLNHFKSEPGLWKTIFPVAFHVDYWDGLGWPDRFARAEYTQRQRDYATRLGQDSVYTPEFVLNGLEWRRGWSGPGIPDRGPVKSGILTVSADARKVTAFYDPGAVAAGAELSVNVALLGFDLVTDVKRGENGGRTLKHDFVVLGFQSRAMAADGKGVYGAGPIEMKTSTDDAPGAVVVWVSRRDGAILQVAGGWLRDRQ
jgi:hypothetical protein